MDSTILTPPFSRSFLLYYLINMYEALHCDLYETENLLEVDPVDKHKMLRIYTVFKLMMHSGSKIFGYYGDMVMLSSALFWSRVDELYPGTKPTLSRVEKKSLIKIVRLVGSSVNDPPNHTAVQNREGLDCLQQCHQCIVSDSCFLKDCHWTITMKEMDYRLQVHVYNVIARNNYKYVCQSMCENHTSSCTICFRNKPWNAFVEDKSSSKSTAPVVDKTISCKQP